MSSLARFKRFLTTREGKVTAGVVGAGGVVGAALYARSKNTGAAAGYTVDQAQPAYGTATGAGGGGGDVDPFAGFADSVAAALADQLGAQTDSIVGAIDANNQSVIASVQATLDQITAKDAARTAASAVTGAVSGSGSSTSTTAQVPATSGQQQGFLAALAAEVNRRRAAGQSDLEIDRYLWGVAVAGGADPNKLGSVSGTGPSLARPTTATNWSFNPQRLAPLTAAAVAAPAARTKAMPVAMPAAALRPAATTVPVATPMLPATGLKRASWG